MVKKDTYRFFLKAITVFLLIVTPSNSEKLSKSEILSIISKSSKVKQIKKKIKSISKRKGYSASHSIKGNKKNIYTNAENIIALKRYKNGSKKKKSIRFLGGMCAPYRQRNISDLEGRYANANGKIIKKEYAFASINNKGYVPGFTSFNKLENENNFNDEHKNTKQKLRINTKKLCAESILFSTKKKKKKINNRSFMHEFF